VWQQTFEKDPSFVKVICFVEYKITAAVQNPYLVLGLMAQTNEPHELGILNVVWR
jgi:hypothetical protein